MLDRKGHTLAEIYFTATQYQTHFFQRRSLKMAQRPGQPDVRAALQRYQLHGVRETGEELGRGSYAAVVEVDYKGMRCAAKKIYSILSQRGEGDRLVARFEEECRLLGALRHPHIVQFLGIYFDPATDLPVLVMEFLPTTLSQCVERYGRLPAEICYAILRDVRARSALPPRATSARDSPRSVREQRFANGRHGGQDL